MRFTGPLIFFTLIGFTTVGIWPLYKDAIEEDLSTKVKRLYVNQIHNTPEINFDGLHLQIDSGELTPYFHQKLERISGAYIPEPTAKKVTPKKPTKPSEELIAKQGEEEKKPILIQPAVTQQETSFNLTRLTSTVRFGGVLPSKDAKEKILSIIKELAPNSTLIDQTKIASHPAPAWWHSHPVEFLPEFLGATHGYASLSYGKQHFGAIAKVSDPNELSRLQSELSQQIPDSVTQDAKLSFLAPPKIKPIPVNPLPSSQPAGKAMIVSVDENQPTDFDQIQFKFGGGGSSWLHPKYDKKLKYLTALINGYPDPQQRFTITSFGTTPLKLSRARAKAVRKKLIDLGIPSERLLTAHLKRKKGEARRVELKLSTRGEIEEQAAFLAAESKKKEEKIAAEKAAIEAKAKAEMERKAKEEAERLAEAALPPVPEPLKGMSFTFGGGGSAWLHPKNFPRLKELATMIQEFPDAGRKFTVASYGTTKPELSTLRAKAIRDKLIELGAPSERILLGEFGKRKNQKRRVQLNFATEEDIQKAVAQEETIEAPVEEEQKAEEENQVAPPKETIVKPKPAPIPPAERLKKLPITFSGEFSSWIHSSYFPQLRKMAGIINETDPTQMIIVGSYGSTDRSISQKRAESAMEKLIADGVPSDRLIIEHFDIEPGEDSRIELTFGKILEIPKAEIISEEEPAETTTVEPSATEPTE